MPSGTLKGGVQLLRDLAWPITVSEENGVWRVYRGENLLLTTDSRDAVDTFFYGAALAYGGLNEDLMREFRARMEKYTKPVNWPFPNKDWPPGKIDPTY